MNDIFFNLIKLYLDNICTFSYFYAISRVYHTSRSTMMVHGLVLHFVCYLGTHTLI